MSPPIFNARGVRAEGGFTLIELMVAVAIAAILSAIALPAYMAYVQRARVPPALDALSSYHVRMEQRFQDVGSYSCALVAPAASHFTISCSLSAGGFTASAVGSGPMTGYEYRINESGTRTTHAHPKGKPAGSCWSIKGQTCDA
jgi:type IV pilus assembly protein PilE